MILKNLQVLTFGLFVSVLISTNLFSMQVPSINKSQSINHLIKKHQLPYRGGMMRYIPPMGYFSQGLPRGRLPGGNKGFKDKFGNIWVMGPSRTAGERFEWDVQLAPENRARLKTLAAGTGTHLNVSLKGNVTHY